MTATDQTILQELAQLRTAAAALNRQPEEKLNDCLRTLADLTEENIQSLLAANALDLARMDPENPKYDRLLLNEDRLRDIAADLRRVAALPSPLGVVHENRTLGNDMTLRRISVPIGVVGIVFESRPNVTFDVFALNLKAGNASVLKGSRDARDSNIAIKKLIDEALDNSGMPPACYLAPPEREALKPILEADGLVDVIIPRGSQGLIDFVRANSSVPVIETGAGICHTYIDEEANPDWAKAIVTNAKSRRVSVCNALDCILLHCTRVSALPDMLQELGQTHRCEVFADERAYAALNGKYPAELLHRANTESFGTEFLSMKLSVKTVDDISEAIAHVERYGSRHSESIVTDNEANKTRYLKEVDAAVVYANASTAFTDGGQFELGAEIGISTQKLHARGPMGLATLCSYKWLVEGKGETRN
ncbi:glutamate-5-semialdehyde dehydrogenase [Neolewinella aurantiaca]|uniref:Gamma-glutamyl phosphate reductase n=1 Tax=Neolewinella aurantiaca TaxID=2602767 RepID=A0A5C7FDV1_9BACT|nr:glutamate-5-semialdehyde dehydrogenase [Neolewinella aurantiaca]TXF83357.1 glutamate-5-semialdehyde dehydrogenase [Neolewinella aurantiaca]